MVGVASTLAYAVLYVLLRGPFPAFTANLLALLLTAVANTAANRRLTFGVRGRDALRHQLQGWWSSRSASAVTSGRCGCCRRPAPTNRVRRWRCPTPPTWR